MKTYSNKLMSRPVLIYLIAGSLLTGCTGLKNALAPRQAPEVVTLQAPADSEPKFLDDISVSIEAAPVKNETVKKTTKPKTTDTKKTVYKLPSQTSSDDFPAYMAKYAELVNTPVYELKNVKLFGFIDEWYGTPYRYGGTTKKGVDCSAFSQYLFSDVYGITLPRTARDQYKLTNRISRTELREGDLIFFNTRGGVSHVGVYLQNNKFVHASTSGGVTISDIFESYWVKRFIGVGRIKEEIMIAGGQ